MKKKYVMTAVVAVACFSLMVGCSTKSRSSNETNKSSTNEKIHVTTTFYPMYEFTKQVAGDKADVELLIPSTVEPHDWEPSPKDMKNIQQSDLVVYNSPYMETWEPSIEKSINSEGPTFVKASTGIELMNGIEDEEEKGKQAHAYDPHVWLSPVLAQKEVKNIAEALEKADPDNKDYYEKNSEKYIDQLKDLDKKYQSTLKDVRNKELITQHAAFGYLAKQYGLTQVPIAGLSPEQEPSAAKLAELKKFAQTHHVKTIYFEELTSPKVAKTLADEVGAKTEVLNTLEGLSKEQQKQGLDYIEAMENNLKQLQKSLSE
ncbi:metal ABC transporter substrate-binding protein [Priestia megaterium]|uniref:metal ABC transporter substrate-binding protein n=1 Tax=Priestia megaterium TaxID=1404 RepID=UPI0004704FB0|nr:metal ABC transporter substrate-binding protein [Priestia megaterium]MED3916234.1 metal ABC transporter substrate-binding protein [Priestia megaterium]PFB00393.1 zinc ABC transporter substrate-binding protein [Priestia megaterium]